MKALSKVLLVGAALDSVAMGALGLIYPSALFHFLHIPPNNDGFLLCRLLGLLFLAHGPCLFLAARNPGVYGGLTLAPLFGRMLSCGVWLWLLGSPRTTADHGALFILLVHDAVWLPIFHRFLAMMMLLNTNRESTNDENTKKTRRQSYSSLSPFRVFVFRAFVIRICLITSSNADLI